MRIRDKVVYNEASFGLFARSLTLASKLEFLPALSRPRAVHITFKAHTLIQVGIGQSHDSKSILHEPQIFS